MKTQQVLFARHSNALKGDAPFSSQRALNMYAEAGEPDDYGQIMMRHSSGLRLVHDFGSPVRALKCVAEKLYAVADYSLWMIEDDGEVTRLGRISADDPCTFISGNRTQVAVTAGGKMYVYDGTSLAEAADDNTPADIETMDYLDGFGIATQANSDQFFVTNLTNFDSINALDFASAESLPDRITRVLVDHKEVWLFGPKSIEVYYNSGGADFPFSRANEAALERGLVGKFTPAKMDNSVYWVGDDLEVKWADGYIPRRVSTHAVERCIHDLTVSQREQLRGFVYREEGHKFYCLRFPNGTAWLFDVATQMWHERGTNGGTWLATMTEHAHGVNYAGSDRGGVYVIDRDFYYDHDIAIEREMISPAVHFGDRRFSSLHFAADIRSGWSELDVEPQVQLSVSKDRGHTWYRKGLKGMGKRGEFNKLLRWWGMGSAREMYLKLRVVEPVALSLYASHVMYSVGES